MQPKRENLMDARLFSSSFSLSLSSLHIERERERAILYQRRREALLKTSLLLFPSLLIDVVDDVGQHVLFLLHNCIRLHSSKSICCLAHTVRRCISASMTSMSMHRNSTSRRTSSMLTKADRLTRSSRWKPMTPTVLPSTATFAATTSSTKINRLPSTMKVCAELLPLFPSFSLPFSSPFGFFSSSL